jgi:hypothetical protein
MLVLSREWHATVGVRTPSCMPPAHRFALRNGTLGSARQRILPVAKF